MSTIGEQIKDARKAKKMTQEELADALHVARSSIASWEVGRRMPDLEMIMRLSQVLDVRFDVQQAVLTKDDIETTVQEDQLPDERTAADEQMQSQKGKNKKIWVVGSIGLAICLIACVLLLIWPRIFHKSTAKPYTASDGEIYTIERFKQATAVNASCAYLRLNPTLTVSKGENVDYWLFSVECHEMNGIGFDIDRVEQVYFAKEKANVEMIITSADMTAYGMETNIPPYGDWSYTGGLPVQNTVYGVGILIRGTDTAGVSLAFPVYIPFAD